MLNIDTTALEAFIEQRVRAAVAEAVGARPEVDPWLDSKAAADYLGVKRVGFANSSAASREPRLARFVSLAVVEGGLFALVVRVSRCPEPVRVGMAAGAASSLEG